MLTNLSLAHIGDFRPDAANGVATSGWWLAISEAKLGARVFFYRGGDVRSNEAMPNSSIFRRTFPFSMGRLGLSRSLFGWIKANRDHLNILHFHSVFIPLNAYLARACKKAKINYVLTPNGGYDSNIFGRGFIKKKLYFALFEKYILSNASGILCVTDREVNDIVRLGFAGPIQVAPNLFPLSEFLSIRHDPKKNVIWLGRFDIFHKGLDRLIQIWTKVESALANFELHLYGEGSDCKALETIIFKNGTKRAFLHPPVYGSNKSRVFSEAALYIHCSRWEVFGVTIAEAMAASLPVAVSRGCYIQDAVIEGKAGVVLPDNDSDAAALLVQLLSNKAECNHLGLNGRSYAENHFNGERVAAEVLDFYHRVTSPQ